MNATILFWLLFVIINAFYFIPRYLLEIFHSQAIPIRSFTSGTIKNRFRSLLIRRNYDVIRISIDFLILSCIYPLFLKEYISIGAYAIGLSCYFWLSLMYQVYYHSFHRIYRLDPVFFHDFLMLKTAAQIFIHDFQVKNVLMALSLAVIGLAGAFMIYLMVSVSAVASFGILSYVVMGIFGAGALYSLLSYNYEKYPQLTFQSPLQSFVRNLILSRRSKQSLSHLTLKYMKQFNVDPQIKLDKRPNIYFIVIESYGHAAIHEGTLRDQFASYASQLEQRLQQKHWHISSGYTISPVTGGASWISYTSLLYGLNVRNQGVYLTMLKNNYMPEYDSLFHWLRRQGYVTFRISSLGGYEKMEIPYDRYSLLYGIDHWIKYKDLAFTGEHYGFGPSPPDQYALWKGDQIAKDLTKGQPRAVFFITQNSHTPYESPSEVSSDWQGLNEDQNIEKKTSKFWSRPKFEKYASAIQYQLEYLTDFIIKSGTDDDIFILVGDHQPPSLSIALDNFNTPMHILSKDAALHAHLMTNGMTAGLVPDEKAIPLRQEAIHWMMLRTLIGSYGQAGAKIPEFLPNGIPY